MMRPLAAIISKLYPPTCILCKAPGYNGLDLCLGCYTDLPYIWHGCNRCAKLLPTHTTNRKVTLCGSCQHKPPIFDSCKAVLSYADAVPYLITGFKFRQHLAYGRLLGNLLADKLAVNWQHRQHPKPTCIIPVPLHVKRLQERGFNQSLELSRMVARRLKLPIDIKNCTRIRRTIPQPGLTSSERLHNLDGAFRIKPVLPAWVAILDDVVTTGATANELAKTLKQSGVQYVEVWTVARVVDKY